MIEVLGTIIECFRTLSAKDTLRTNARAFLKGRYSRNRRATLPVHSQSPHPAHPIPAYIACAFEGMSLGLLPELQ